MTRHHLRPSRFGVSLALIVMLCGLLASQTARAETPISRAALQDTTTTVAFAATAASPSNQTFIPKSNEQNLSARILISPALLNTVTIYNGQFHDAYINADGTGPCTYPYTPDDYIMAYHCGAKVPVFTIVFTTATPTPDIVTIARTKPDASGLWSPVTPTITLAASTANDGTTHVYNIWPADDAYQFLWPGYKPWAAHEPPNDFWYNAWIAIRIGADPTPYVFKLISTTN